MDSSSLYDNLLWLPVRHRMGEVVKDIFASQEEFANDSNQFRELEIVRQALIAVEKMKKNGDSTAEGELGDVVATFL